MKDYVVIERLDKGKEIYYIIKAYNAKGAINQVLDENSPKKNYWAKSLDGMHKDQGKIVCLG